MPTLKDLVEDMKQRTGLSYERMAREADISRNQFTNVLDTGLIDRTEYKTIRGLAKLLSMETWELIKLLEAES